MRTPRISSVFFHGPVSNWHGREESWRQLDGLQQLGWMAVARAVAEPELDRQAITAALDSMQAATDSRAQGNEDRREAQYLWQLARELGTSPIGQWLQHRSSWPEIVRLAFGYLDVDGDGVLGGKDLAAHVSALSPANDETATVVATVKRDVWTVTGKWVLRWQDPDAPLAMSQSGFQGLSPTSFRAALLASQCNDPIFEPFEPALDLAERSSEGTGNEAAGKGDSLLNLPTFSQVVAAAHDHEEEEICWQDMVGRGQAQLDKI